MIYALSRLVHEVGLEPTRPRGHQLLRLARLPFRHSCKLGLIRNPDYMEPYALLGLIRGWCARLVSSQLPSKGAGLQPAAFADSLLTHKWHPTRDSNPHSVVRSHMVFPLAQSGKYCRNSNVRFLKCYYITRHLAFKTTSLYCGTQLFTIIISKIEEIAECAFCGANGEIRTHE